VELNDLSLYCDVNGNTAGTTQAKPRLTHQEWIARMRDGIGATAQCSKHEYVLAPTSGLAKCTKVCNVRLASCVEWKIEITMSQRLGGSG
jgi:hypothetical protein